MRNINKLAHLGFLLQNGIRKLKKFSEVESIVSRVFFHQASRRKNRKKRKEKSLKTRFEFVMYIVCCLLIIGSANLIKHFQVRWMWNVTVLNSVLYFKLFSFVVPGEPYPVENDNPPAPVPAPAADNFEGTKMIILFHILTILKSWIYWNRDGMCMRPSMLTMGLNVFEML